MRSKNIYPRSFQEKKGWRFLWRFPLQVQFLWGAKVHPLTLALDSKSLCSLSEFLGRGWRMSRSPEWSFLLCSIYFFRFYSLLHGLRIKSRKEWGRQGDWGSNEEMKLEILTFISRFIRSEIIIPFFFLFPPPECRTLFFLSAAVSSAQQIQRATWIGKCIDVSRGKGSAVCHRTQLE